MPSDQTAYPVLRMAEPRDPYVVCREPLAELVQSFISEWNRNHDPDGGRFSGHLQRKQMTQIRAVQWLAEETRRNDPDGIGVTEDAIRNMFRRTPEGQLRSRTIDLRTADALVTVIGHPEVFHTEPMRPRTRRDASCCSGSLTGVIPPDPTSF